jgi:hypothetical protein
MTIAPVKQSVKILLFMIGLLFGTVGFVVLFSAMAAYLTGDQTDGLPFRNILLSTSLIGVPASLFLLYRSHQNWQYFSSEYDLPESPISSVVLAFLTGAVILATIASFVIFSILFL